jgi:hypothetical protein
VFVVAFDAAGAHLFAIAFGVRHPPPGRRRSVYAIAHERLHAPEDG